MNKFNIYILILLGVFLFSCKTDPSVKAKEETIKVAKELKQIPSEGRVNNLISPERLKGPIPYPCDLLTNVFIGETLGVDAGSIVLKEGTAPTSTDQRACFFKWTDTSYPNAGVMIQVMKNPMPEEVDTWVKHYIDSKKSMGEKSMESDVAVMFVPYNDLGDSGAANIQVKKFYWELNDDLVFLVAYNLTANNEQLRDWTKKLGTELMKNYNTL